ncbi:ABC transporter permease [Paenibacillus sp. 32O-W]|jgi:ABC-type sugar transport system, permease component|uniref:carbohydrate ABC transporter permease n=1 Tax=Paenibacillus sp. 32O-W TaxID=1695218 RepID=UPI00071FB2A2|nr:carbohydrate ABC transporter permease [Paenibacillus sp. 32O-W]ALS26566.1 ABC transporter permease [Paenibacillus sp. 32O-W]
MRQRTLSFAFGSAANHLLLALFGMVTLFPFLHVLAQSLSSQTAVVSNQVTIFPVDFQIEAYKLLLRDQAFYQSFGISIVRVVAGVAINMAVTSLMAYPLSRKDLKGRSLIMNMVIFTMLFQGGLIPSFLLLKELHMLDTLWALLLPSAVSAFNLILLKNFFQSIPVSLEESAKMDGAGHDTILWRIYMPLSMPAVATLTLFYAVMHWNTYFDAVMYISNPELNPLQVYLRNMIVLNDSNIELTNNTGLFLVSPETLKAATIMASVIPMILIYPFIQKYFAKGVMLGSLKE